MYPVDHVTIFIVATEGVPGKVQGVSCAQAYHSVKCFGLHLCLQVGSYPAAFE
jgi:hypothetical protein